MKQIGQIFGEMGIPRELVEDASGFDLLAFMERPRDAPSPASKPAPVRGTPEWMDALADAEMTGGDGLIDPALRVELIAGVLEGLEGADTEGLGDPHLEDAAGTVDWILDKLRMRGLLVGSTE